MGIVIAIDGPAGAGKSTVARQLAAQLGFTYIDTGAMYRALGLWAVRQKLEPTDMHRMEQLADAASIAFLTESDQVILNGEDVSQAIRGPGIAEAASHIAAIPAVRRSMVAKQREIASGANVVMEGRDIGSVVFPDARVKIFLDADPGERVRRRAGQTGESDTAMVRKQINERDDRDRNRAEAPLTQAPDAVYVDSTNLSVQEVLETLLRLVRARMTNGKAYS